MKPLTRKIHLDYLRCFIILLVVAFHTSLSFMSKAPAWWYVKSDTTSILFTIFVIITDVFMMPILFLISGYVLSIQLRNIDSTALLLNRVKKLGIPWIICVLIFSPFFSLLMARSLGNNLSYSEIITHYFWTDYYSQGPYWFLGLLLTFSAVIIFLNQFESIKIRFQQIPNVVIWFMLFIFPLLGYSTGSFFFGTDNWVNPFYILSFQPSRILTYLSYFLAGYILSEKGYNKVNSIGRWLIGTLLLVGIFTILKGTFEGTTSFSRLFILGSIYAGLVISMSALLHSVFFKYWNKRIKLFSFLTNHSFMIYLFHLPIQVLVAGWVVNLPISIYGRWAVLFISVIALSIGVSYSLMLVLKAGSQQGRN